MALSCKISNVEVDLQSISRPDRIDEPSLCAVTLIDSAGTALYQKGQPVLVIDSNLGTLFEGNIQQSHMENLYPNDANLWTLTCVARGDYLASKRTSDWTYANQFAGPIVVDQIQRYGAAEGLRANAALRWDETQEDWAAGTVANIVATTNASSGNVGGGCLELAPAGIVVSINLSTSANWGAGTHTGTTVVGNVLQPASTPAIKYQTSCLIDSAGDVYNYVNIWDTGYTLGSNYYLVYSVWMDPNSAEKKMALDVTFDDGTTLRGNSTNNDLQNLSPSPSTDLADLANGKWYYREIKLSAFNGKTILHIDLVIEGDEVGDYTGWFKEIFIKDNSFNTVITVFNGTLAKAQQVQAYGYTKPVLSVVNTYNLPYYESQGEGSSPLTSGVVYWKSSAYSIDAAKIYKSSLLAYQATIPDGTLLKIKYTLDYASGNTAEVPCTNNAVLPSLPAGLSIAGRSIKLLAYFYRDASANPLASPEVCPSLSSVNLTINPSYVMSGKTDVESAFVKASDWATGTTMSNTAASFLSNKLLSLAGGYNNTFDSSLGSKNTFGTSSPISFINNQTLALSTGTATTDAKVRLNDPGQPQDFTAEFVTYVASTYVSSFVYRTTNWENNDKTHGYSVDIRTDYLELGKGTNSSTQIYTQISHVGLTLSSGNWHRIKVVVIGSSHKIYLDNIKYIDSNDSTFTGAGYVGFRIWNNTGVTRTAYFNDLGIVTALSGMWTSGNISVAGATTYGAGYVSWRDQHQADSPICSSLVEVTANDGANWYTCTNGGLLPVLTAGQSLSGINLKFRVTLTTTSATSLPALDNLVIRVLQQFSSSGTRIAPPLSLARVKEAGTTLASWNALLPTGTGLAVSTSIDNGLSHQTVVNSGGVISGISARPDEIEDFFRSDTSSNYVAGNWGGANGTWIPDTANSRLTGSSGNFGTYVYSTTLTSADNETFADFDQADGSGLITCYTATNSGYYILIYDASASATPNTCKLFRRSGSTSTQVGSTASISFTRGHIRRFLVGFRSGVITVKMDGEQIIQYADSSPLSTGKSGFVLNAQARVYSLRIQQHGQDVSELNVSTLLTLTSTDPLVTPQVLNLQVFVSSPDIGKGALVDAVDYRGTFLSDNIADLNTRSDYWWCWEQISSVAYGSGVYGAGPYSGAINLIFQKREAKPAPFVLADANISFIAGQSIGDILLEGLGMDFAADKYRNRMRMRNAINENTTQDIIRDNTGQFDNTIGQTQMAALENAAGGMSSGIIEAVYDASKLTVTEATTLADQLLRRYGVIGRTFTPKTLRSGLKTGMQISLFSSRYKLWNTQMLITQVDVTRYTTPAISGGQLYAYKLTVTESPNLGSWVMLFKQLF